MLITKILVAIQIINYQRISTHTISLSKTFVKRTCLDNIEELFHAREGSEIGEVAYDGKQEKICSSEDFKTPFKDELSNESDLENSESISYEDLSSFVDTPLEEWIKNTGWDSLTEGGKTLHNGVRYKIAFFVERHHLSSLSPEIANNKSKQFFTEELDGNEKNVLFKYLNTIKNSKKEIKLFSPSIPE